MRKQKNKEFSIKKHYPSRIIKPQMIKETLQALKESEERYRQLVELSPDAIIVHSEGKITFANNATVDLYGAPLAEIIGKEVMDIVHESSRGIALNRIKQILNEGIPVPITELRHRRMDGTIFDVEVTASPLIIQGKTMVQAVIRDITQRKKIDKELHRLNKERELVLSSISELVVYYDCNMKIKWANMSAINSYDFFPEQLVGHHCYEVWQNTSNPCPECPVLKSIETNAPQKGEITTPDGACWSIRAYPVWDENYILTGVVKVAREITEKKHIEREMARLDSLNIIGQMAAGIGHEIRNPLATVLGYLQFLSTKQECLPFKDQYELMIEELERANCIISEFLFLAKDKPIELKNHNLNNIINTLYPLIEVDALNSDKLVELKLTEIPNIVFDQKEIRQLLWNLVRNGLEAMNEGGVLSIETYCSNGEVILAVKDEGKGFDPSILDKIGVPFVTTKENGTGLGLAICFSIAERHNARIEITSNPDGTIILVHFHI